jgi:hypothetical protein
MVHDMHNAPPNYEFNSKLVSPCFDHWRRQNDVHDAGSFHPRHTEITEQSVITQIKN